MKFPVLPYTGAFPALCADPDYRDLPWTDPTSPEQIVTMLSLCQVCPGLNKCRTTGEAIRHSGVNLTGVWAGTLYGSVEFHKKTRKKLFDQNIKVRPRPEDPSQPHRISLLDPSLSEEHPE